MKSIRLLLTIFLLASVSACSSNKKPKPPVADKIPFEVFDKRIDNYYWMRLSDEQKAASEPDEQTKKVLAYLNSENEYTNAVMKHTEPLQKKIFDEIVGRIKKEDESVPYLDNGYYYYTRYLEGSEYPVYLRRKESPGAKEEILLDVNKLAEGQEFCSVAQVSVSRDNKLLAFGMDTVGRRRYTIWFVDLETGSFLPDKIDNTTGQAEWAADNKTVFYVGKDFETLRADRVLRHKLGENPEGDETVFFEDDETFSVDLQLTKSKKYIVIQSRQTLSTEARLIDVNQPYGSIIVFEPRSKNHEYHIDHLGREFFIRTNADGASNFKLMKTEEGRTGKEYWKDVIPHRSDVLLENFELFHDYLVASERIKGLPNLRIISLKGAGEHYLDFGEETYTASINVNPNAGTEILRYSYTSLTTP
ncbi:MAG: S9 family peptidase, partial [Bacteroidales bacterium]|nr:S9 family peptidase [Bacteroidales bacterium]